MVKGFLPEHNFELKRDENRTTLADFECYMPRCTAPSKGADAFIFVYKNREIRDVTYAKPN